MKNLIFLMLAIASAGLAQANPVSAAYRVVGVSDGDTLTIMRKHRPLKVRLANVDSPEKRQEFGQRAKQSLSDMCYRKDALVKILSTDRYGRAIALVSCNGIDVNRAQVERGLAWVYTKYNQDPSLPAVQAAALAKRRGLWVDAKPEAPWNFRRSEGWNARGPRT